jgi:N-formylglutamate amidohydrolase
MPAFQLTVGPGPLVAAAVHDGHDADPDTESRFALGNDGRLREEDPFTADLAAVVPTRIVGTRSRFEVDLNRPRERAVYRRPEDAWGLTVWAGDLPEAVAQRSLRLYDDFYAALDRLVADKIAEEGPVVVLDVHSYNHRRDGADAPPADAEANPEVNVGTGTLDRDRWGPLVDRFLADLAGAGEATSLGRALDVRENVKFQGGHLSQHLHARFGSDVCVLAVEFKKTFMNEWTGVPDVAHLAALREALDATLPGLLNARAEVLA